MARQRRGIAARIGIGILAFLVVLVVIAGILIAVKPWAPKIVVTEPGASGRRVTDAGMLANYYPSTKGGRQPAVLIVGGSDGGLAESTDHTAQALQADGFTVLALSYWGGPGQPQSMESLPLETFTTALGWLKSQPEVNPSELAFMGTSKGAEAAMLLASRDPELKAVVGYTPSSVVWAGINQREPWKLINIGSTWSADGQPLPFVPYSKEFRGGPTIDLYTMSLAAAPQHPDAIIPVEKSKAPLLLLCGGADAIWPSCAMSEQIKARAESKNGPDVTILSYPQLGHFVGGAPYPAGHTDNLKAFGGTQEAFDEARADSWPKVLAFLHKNLG